MKKLVTQVKRTIATLLAIMMVVTAVPQTAATVKGEDLSGSDEVINLESETVIEDVDSVSEVIEEEIVSTEEITEEFVSEEIIEEESEDIVDVDDSDEVNVSGDETQIALEEDVELEVAESELGKLTVHATNPDGEKMEYSIIYEIFQQSGASYYAPVNDDNDWESNCFYFTKNKSIVFEAPYLGEMMIDSVGYTTAENPEKKIEIESCWVNIKHEGEDEAQPCSCYEIPVSATNGDIDVYIKIREAREIAVEFIHDSSEYKVSEFEGAPNEESEYSFTIYEGSVKNEACGFKIEPEEGKQIAVVSSDEVSIFRMEDNTYGFYKYGLTSDTVHIKVLMRQAGQVINYLQYDPSQVIAEIFKGEEKIKPVSKDENEYYYEESFALDNNQQYRFVAVSKSAGYKINKGAYSISSSKHDAWNPSNNKIEKTFTPKGDGWLIWVASEASYGASVYSDDVVVEPNSGVFKVDWNKPTTFKYAKGDVEDFNPTKVLVYNGSSLLSDAYDYDNKQLRLNKNTYGKKLKVEVYDNVNGQEKVVSSFYIQSTVPVTSVTVANVVNSASGKYITAPFNRTVAKYKLTVNSGATISDIGLYNPSDNIVKCYIEGEYLCVEAQKGSSANDGIGLKFYDKNSYIEGQPYIDNVNVIIGKPSWASLKPSISLAKSTDTSLTFNLKMPNGMYAEKPDFDDSQYVYYVHVYPVDKEDADAVESELLIPAMQTSIDIKAINADFGGGKAAKFNAEISLGLLKSANSVTEVTDDLSVLNENVYYGTNVYKLSNVATKEPYYADKITLKKGVSKLYAGDENKVVATIDFGKNTTYTRVDDWEITNAEALENNGIIAAQEGSNGIKLTTDTDTKAGKYTVDVATKGNGVPARASMQIEILPTATEITTNVEELNMFHNTKKDTTAAVKTTILSQDGTEIKGATLAYKIGKLEDDEIVPVTGLTVSKGTVKVSKTFKPDEESSAEYCLQISGTVGTKVETIVSVNIFEEIPTVRSLKIGETPVENGASMTLAKYFEIIEGLKTEDSEWQVDKLPAVITLNDNIDAGAIVLSDEDEVELEKEFIKEIKIPNPSYVTKVGNNTISIVTIDGITTKMNVNIVKDEVNAFDKLVVTTSKENVTLNGGETSNVTVGTLETIDLWLTDGAITTAETISGYKLAVTGAKVVNNWHNDCLRIVMTAKNATITKMDGNKKLETFNIENSAFDQVAPKITANASNKVYTAFATSQTAEYILGKTYGDVTVRIWSTNAIVNGLITGGKITAELKDDDKTIKVTVDSIASNAIKAGTYPINVELVDEEDIPICKPATAILKLETLKKNYKLNTKYTMSNVDATSVVVKATSSAGVDNVSFIEILNDNIKGKYNNIADILKVTSESTIIVDVENEKVLPSDKSITGYISYKVNYLDGTSEVRLDKITISIAKQAHKYTSDAKKVTYVSTGSEIAGIKVYGDNQQLAIAKAIFFDEVSKKYVDSYSVETDGTLSVKLNGDTTNSTKSSLPLKLKVNIIPEGSAYETEKVMETNSVQVVLNVTVIK